MAENDSEKKQYPTRYIGFILALALGFHTISFSYSSMLPLSNLAGQFHNTKLSLVIGPGNLLALFFALCYVLIGVAVQRSGADYILGSRVLSAPLAFASSFLLVTLCGITAGSLVAAIPQEILPAFLNLFGLMTGQDVKSIISGITNSSGVVLIGTLIIVLAFASLIFKPRWIQLMFITGMVLTLLAWGIMIFQLSNRAIAFQTAWDQLLGSGSFAEHIETAQNLGVFSQIEASGKEFSIFFIGFWISFGALVPTFVAGEVKKPSRTIFFGSWGALLLAGVMFPMLVVRLQSTVQPEFLAAEIFLNQSKAFTGLTLPYIPVYASLLNPNLVLTVIIAIAWIYSMFNLVQAFLFFSSRIMLSWAKDQIVASGFLGYVHPSRRAPVLALATIASIAFLGLMDAAQPARLFIPSKLAFPAALCMLIPVLSAILLPFKRKDLFQRMPRLVRFKIGPLPLISLIGVTGLIFLVGVIASAFMLPNQPAAVTLMDAVFYVIFFGSGILVYFKRRDSLRQKGVFLEESFKEFPQGD